MGLQPGTHLGDYEILSSLGELDRAERAIASAHQRVGDDPVLTAFEALLWALRGDETSALASLERLGAHGPSRVHEHLVWHHAAQACACIGRSQEAVEHLRTASRTGLPNHPVFKEDPFLQNLRSETSFVTLMDNLERDHRQLRREFFG